MTDTYSPDRQSIVTFLSNIAAAFDKGPERDLVYSLVTQINRGDDITPAKPKATIADLLALHDLDLGALAHKVGSTFAAGIGLTTLHVEALCTAYVGDADDRFDLAEESASYGDYGHVEACRRISAIGAKVRAALSAPTIKVAMPRVLQSADEAPCGSLMQDGQGVCSVRRPDGSGWNLYHLPREAHPYNPSKEAWHGGPWKWDEALRGVRGPVTVIAEGLTEAECRHLSGLSVADALVWCEARDKACATHDAAVIDRLQRDGDSLRSLLAVIRHALGAGDHDDIVKHARAIKARADRA